MDVGSCCFPTKAAAPGSGCVLPWLCLHCIRVARRAAKQRAVAGDFCWEAASWCLQICSAGPLAAGGNQCVAAHRREASLITCLEVIYLGVCSDLAGAESCMVWQRFPEWAQGKADLGERKLWVGKW